MPARDSEMRSSPPVAPSVREFYDGFAAEYHLVYGDSWDAAVERQGASLHRLIRNANGSGVLSVLDCSCGIGTQAIGLARQGIESPAPTSASFR